MTEGKYFPIRVTEHWNKLPAKIINANILDMFIKSNEAVGVVDTGSSKVEITKIWGIFK